MRGVPTAFGSNKNNSVAPTDKRTSSFPLEAARTVRERDRGGGPPGQRDLAQVRISAGARDDCEKPISR